MYDNEFAFPTNEKYVRLIKNKAKKILGLEYYNLLYSMFYSILNNSEYDTSVMVTRKSYILYKIFASIILDDLNGITNKMIVKQNMNKVVNDISLCKIQQMLSEDKKILIVDDILVHGKGIGVKLDKLANWGVRPNQIDILVYICDCEKEKYFSNDLYNKLSYMSEEYSEERVIISNNLVKLIVSTIIPYSSYIFGAFCYENTSELHEKMFCESSWNKEYNESKWLKNDYGVRKATYFGREKIDDSLQDFFDIFVDFSAMRVYSYKDNDIECSSLVPFVFLKPMKSLDKDMLEVVNQLMLLIFGACEGREIKKSFNSFNMDCNRYKGRLFNCLLSYLYGITYLKKTGLNNIINEYDFQMVEKSFGENIKQDFQKINVDFIENFAIRWDEFKKNSESVQLLKSMTNVEEHENVYLLDKLVQIVQSKSEFILETESEYEEIVEDIIVEYFIASGISGQESREAIDGLSTGCLVDTIYRGLQTTIPVEKAKIIVYRALLHSWDIGESSGHFSSTHNYNVTVHTHGEQHFVSGIKKYAVEIDNCQKALYGLKLAMLFGGDSSLDYEKEKKLRLEKSLENCPKAKQFIQEHLPILERIGLETFI